MSTSTATRIGLLIAALALAPVLLAGSARGHAGHGGPEGGTMDPNAPRRLSEAALKNGGITFEAVATHMIERVITVPGRVVPKPEAVFDVHTPLEGVVLRVDRVPGQEVAAGDIVALLGGPAVAALVSDWDRLRRESEGAAAAVTLLTELVDRETVLAIEQRHVDLMAELSAFKTAEAERAAVQQGGDALPPRELRTRLAAETAARAQLQGQRMRLRAAGLSSEELARLESAPAGQSAAETLGLNTEGVRVRFAPLAEHAADLLERRKEEASAAAVLQGVLLRIRLTGLAVGDLETLARGASEPAVPLRSPIAGVVRSLSVNRGHWVVAGDEIVRIVDPVAIQVEADVPEGDFGAVKSGAAARVRRGGRPDLLLPGTVRWVSPAIDPESRRFHVIVALEGEVAAVPVDLGVDVTLTTERLEEAKSVPVGAVLAMGAEHYVFKQVEDSLVPTAVAVGLWDDRYVQILDGLYAGEKVVVTGAALVRDTPPAPPRPSPVAGPQDPADSGGRPPVKR